MENLREDILDSPIVIDTVICKDVAKTQMKSSTQLGIVLMIIGLVFVVLGLTIAWLKDSTNFGLMITIVVGGAGFGSGFMVYSITKSTIKNVNYFILLKYTFYNDYFMIQQFKDDEVVSWAKVEYNDCQSFTTTDDYVFLTTKHKVIRAIKKEKNIVGFLLSKGLQCTASIK